MKPGAGPRTAACRLMLQMLDPAGALGQKAVRLNVDEVQAPKYPIQIDNNFTVTGNGEFKIMLSSSPLINAVIFSPNAITINGARSITVATPDDFFYTYVLSNKIGYLAVEDQLVVTPKEDFRKYRMIGSAMQLQWSGLELQKNGTFVCARITDKENLATFNPNQKADSVVANGSDVIVCTSQHDEPTFEFLSVDPGNDSGSGNKPTPGQGDFAYEQLTLEFNNIEGLPFQVGPTTVVGGSTTTNRTVMARLALAYTAALGTSATLSKQINDFFVALDAKYPDFVTTMSGTDKSFQATVDVESPFEAVGSVSYRGYARFEYPPQASPSYTTYVNNILAGAASYLASVNLGLPNENFDLFSTVKLTFKIPVNGQINQRIQIPQPITNGVAQNTLNDTPFYDGSFLQPVAHFQGGEFTYQVITTHSWEFILSDDTVLATAAVANTPTDAGSVVNKGQFNAFQKIMKALPPCLIQSDTGMTRATTSQLASRGILQDIFHFAGPIVGAIFPPAAPIIGALSPLVNVVDNML